KALPSSPSSAASRHLLPASGAKALPSSPSSAASRHLLPASGAKALPSSPSSAASRHLLPARGAKALPSSPPSAASPHLLPARGEKDLWATSRERLNRLNQPLPRRRAFRHDRRARPQLLALLGRHLFRGEREDGNASCRLASAQALRDLEAAHPRHRQVEDDDVGLARLGALEAFLAGVGLVEQVALLRQFRLEQVVHAEVVVDQQ